MRDFLRPEKGGAYAKTKAPTLSRPVRGVGALFHANIAGLDRRFSDAARWNCASVQLLPVPDSLSPFCSEPPFPAYPAWRYASGCRGGCPVMTSVPGFPLHGSRAVPSRGHCLCRCRCSHFWSTQRTRDCPHDCPATAHALPVARSSVRDTEI